MASYADNSTMAIADNPLMVTAHKSAVANAVNAATAAATGAEGESSSVRKTQGRRRIEMKKIKKKTSLQVTFAKRRPGLVKKASELSTLCGAEVALLIFSPAGKPYIFGHPDFQKIIDRYLVNNPPSESLTEEDAEMHDVTNELICAELAEKLGNLRVQLAGENDQGAFLDGIWKSFHNSVNWWENPIEGLEINELQYMTQALIWIGERAQRIVRKYMDQGFSDPNFVPYPGDFSSHPAGHHNIGFDSGFGGGIPSVDHQALPNYVSNVAAPASNPTDGANGYGSAFGAGGTLSLLGSI